MKLRTWALMLAVSVIVGATSVTARGVGPLGWRSVADSTPWNGGYYDPSWGQPHALVVPTGAQTHVNYSWGVGNTERVNNYHQFRRRYPGGMGGSTTGFSPQPVWPYHTDQFGTYYVRGPSW